MLIFIFVAKPGGKASKVSGGMAASLDESGKLVWE
jgi:hypothetical protein